MTSCRRPWRWSLLGGCASISALRGLSAAHMIWSPCLHSILIYESLWSPLCSLSVHQMHELKIQDQSGQSPNFRATNQFLTLCVRAAPQLAVMACGMSYQVQCVNVPANSEANFCVVSSTWAPASIALQCNESWSEFNLKPILISCLWFVFQGFDAGPSWNLFEEFQ